MFEFNLQFEDKLSKDFILKNISEERLMEHYLGITPKKGLFKSPLRKDDSETCSFYRSKSGELKFKDFRGDFNGNFIEVVMCKYNCNFITALQIIANDFNLKVYKNLSKNTPLIPYSTEKFLEKKFTKIQVETQDFTSYELSWWNSFGISLKTLNDFFVFSCKHVFLNNNYFTSSTKTNYIFGYYRDSRDDLEYWRLYFPLKSNFRFLSNWTSKFIQGSKQLIMDNENLIITKSLKDVMFLYENSFSSLAPNSEGIIFPENQMNNFLKNFNNIFIFYDNDLAGFRGARKYKNTYPYVFCIFLKRKFAKDISDFFKKNKEETLKALVELKNINILIKNKQKLNYFYYF